MKTKLLLCAFVCIPLVSVCTTQGGNDAGDRQDFTESLMFEPQTPETFEINFATFAVRKKSYVK
jgi:hypothetical protein